MTRKPSAGDDGRVTTTPLDDPTVPVSGPIVDEPASAGGAVDRYVVLEEIGRGGMGRVLRAYDPKLQREVALKQLRRASFSDVDARRLVAEARAMARLSHPNVVAVYDVHEPDENRDDSSLMIVMEYVPGCTLAGWLREAERPWEAVLSRCVEAGRGLAAAHAAGTMHRDFKPANVLLGGDDRDIVKVTDFGLAKRVMSASLVSGESGTHNPVSYDSHEDASSDSGDGEGLTEEGTVLGTPRYMAPEQHLGRPLTPAADQYALCVTVWQALHGEAAFSGRDAGELYMKKIAGPPAWKNTAVPRRVAHAVARGLAPNPDERWASVDELLDVLDYDPARRRTRWGWTAGLVVVAGTAGGGWWSSTQAAAQRCTGAAEQMAGVWDDRTRATVEAAMLQTEHDYAQVAWDRTAAKLDAYAAQWTAEHTDACEASTVRGEQSPAMMDLRMACLQRARQGLVAAVDTLRDADDTVVANTNDLLSALDDLDGCADVEALQNDEPPPRPEDAEAVDRARSLLARAQMDRMAERLTTAQTRLDEAFAALGEADYVPLQIELLEEKGWIHDVSGDYDQAEIALVEALELASIHRRAEKMQDIAGALLFIVGVHQGRQDDALARYRLLAEHLGTDNGFARGAALSHLGSVLASTGKHDDGIEIHRRAVLTLIDALGPDNPEVAMVQANLATGLVSAGDYSEGEIVALAAIERAEVSLGSDHPRLAPLYNVLALAQYRLAKYEEAEAAMRRALETMKLTRGDEHPEVAKLHANIGSIMLERGDLRGALAEHEQALAIHQRTLGPDHPELVSSYNTLGQVLIRLRRVDEAATRFEAARELAERVLSPDDPDLATSYNNLGTVEYRRQRYDQAAKRYRQSIDAWQRQHAPDHPRVANTRINLAGVLSAAGEHEEAETEARRALADLEARLDPEHPDIAGAPQVLGDVARGQGDLNAAVGHYERALSVVGQGDPPAASSYRLRDALASTLLEQGRPEAALPIAQALWRARQQEGTPPADRASAEALLARVLEAAKK